MKNRKFVLKTTAVFATAFVLSLAIQGNRAYAEDYDLEVELTDKSGTIYYLEGAFTGIYATTGEKTVADSGDGWSYDSATNTLTLDNFTGKKIKAKAVADDANFTMVIKGKNKVTETKVVDYSSATIDIGHQSSYNGVHTTLKGDGVLEVVQKNGSQEAVFCDYMTIEDSVTLKCTSNGENGYVATYQTVLGKKARLETTGKYYAYQSAGATEAGKPVAKDKISGTIVAKISGKSGQAYYYTSYNASLASDRVILGGKNKNSLKKIKLVKSGKDSYMEYDASQKLKYVVVCSKKEAKKLLK